MMSIKRIATARSPGRSAVLIRTGKGTYAITHGDRVRFETAEEIEAELERLAALRSDTLGDIYIHINRDDSVALAVGAAPEVWPEDESEPNVMIERRP
jgi:hypothetical protein